MKKNHQRLFLKFTIPSLLILSCLTFFSLYHYASKVQKMQREAAYADMVGWAAMERILVKTREETVVEYKPLPVRPDDKSHPVGWEPEEPNDEGIEYDYLREQNINVSY